MGVDKEDRPQRNVRAIALFQTDRLGAELDVILFLVADDTVLILDRIEPVSLRAIGKLHALRRRVRFHTVAQAADAQRP